VQGPDSGLFPLRVVATSLVLHLILVMIVAEIYDDDAVVNEHC
jgi:hypothetical protein